MNAFANSQYGELKKFLYNGYADDRPPGRFAKYPGQEKDAQRDAILANPPDILLTHYVMLEPILTRPPERRLVEAALGLKFLDYRVINTRPVEHTLRKLVAVSAMGVVQARIQTVEEIDRLVWAAVAGKRPIEAFYHGRHSWASRCPRGQDGVVAALPARELHRIDPGTCVHAAIRQVMVFLNRAVEHSDGRQPPRREIREIVAKQHTRAQRRGGEQEERR